MADLKAIVETASTQINQLAGLTVERIVGMAKRDEGWSLECEVVEREGIPNTMDVIAIYAFDLDAKGHIDQFRRISSRLRGDTIDPS